MRIRTSETFKNQLRLLAELEIDLRHCLTRRCRRARRCLGDFSPAGDLPCLAELVRGASPRRSAISLPDASPTKSQMTRAWVAEIGQR